MQIALALLPLAVLAEPLRPGRTFFYRDILVYWLPQVESFVRAIAEGTLPLWNPYVGFGAPMLADASYQILYPFTWLNLLLMPATTYKALVVSHAALAGIGTFRLARRHGLPEWPAFVAGALWLASGPFLSAVALYHHFVSASWMPWVLLGVENVLEAPGPRTAGRLGLIGALQLLGGSGDLCLMTAMMAGLRAAACLASERPPLLTALRTLRWAGLAALLALGGAAAQWIPTLALVVGSGREQMTVEAKTAWSLSPLSALDVLFPRLIGEAPLNASSRAWLYDGREPFLTFLYLGAATFPLVILGAMSSARRRPWLVVGALLFFWLALGWFNPWYPLLVQIPPFGLLRYPVKYLWPFAFLWCLLAGSGLQDWFLGSATRVRLITAGGVSLCLLTAAAAACLLLAGGGPSVSALLAALVEPSPEARSRFTASALEACVGTLLVLAAALGLLMVRLNSPATARWSAVAMGFLAFADVARVSRTVNPGAPAALLSHIPSVVSWLRSARADARVLSLGAPPSQLARGPKDWDTEARWSLGLLELLRPTVGARYGIFGSYDGNFTGLALASTAELSNLVVRYLKTPLGLRLLRLGGVDYVATLDRSGLPGLAEAAPPMPSVFREPIRLFKVPSPLPRFYAVAQSRVVPEREAYLQLADPGFDPEREVILAPGAGAFRGDPSFVGRVRLLERRMDRILLEADLSSSGFVVLVEAYGPGWRARVDAHPAPVLRANILFRAVAVPAGRHRVELAYRPRAVVWGAALAVSSLVIAIGLAVRRVR